MTFEKRLEEIGEGDEDKKSKRLWDEPWHEGWMLRRGAPGHTEMTQPGKEKEAAFTEALLLAFNFKPFFLLHIPYSSGIDNLRKVHFLSMWSCQSLSGSMDICWFPSLSCWSTCQQSYRSICQPRLLYTPVSLSHLFNDDLHKTMMMITKMPLMPCILHPLCIIKAPLLDILSLFGYWRPPFHVLLHEASAKLFRFSNLGVTCAHVW